MRTTDRVRVDPQAINNTHHASLSDGKNELGFIASDSNGNASIWNISRAATTRTAGKMSSGAQQYSDLLAPWMAISQDDFRGGRAQENFADDNTRFADSYRLQSAMGNLYNAPMEYYSTGIRNAVTNYPGTVDYITLKEGGSRYIAVRFMPSAAFNAKHLSMLIRKRGTPLNPIEIELCADNAGSPGTALVTGSISNTDITDTITEFRRITLPDTPLTAGISYWIKIYSENGDEEHYWSIGIKRVSGTTSKSSDNVIWSASDYDLYYRLTDGDSGQNTLLFGYKYLKFAISQSTGIPKMYINGTLGVADANTGQLDKVIDASKAWIIDQWKGGMVGIISGKGYAEPSVYRKIVSNTATELILEKPYTIEQDTTTEYVIFGTGAWTEIPDTVHGLTERVTDVCVVNDIIYLAQGDHVPIRRMRWSVSGVDGGWVSEAETFNAVYLATVRHERRGLEIWRANNVDKNKNISVSRAAVIDWLGTAMTVLDQTTAITEEFTSPGVDFAQGDDIALEYKLTLGTIAGTNHPYMLVYLQDSDDNQVFTTAGVFQTVDAVGDYYLACQCTRRYRRVLITVAGTGRSFNNINITSTTNLRFHEPVSFHDSYGKINKIIEYSDNSSKNLWVLREGMEFMIKTDVLDSEMDFADPISLPELATVMEEYNGSAAVTSGVYLHFSIGNGIQRYFNQKLDSDGPDRDVGLPAERQGIASSMLGYPSQYFAAIDAGENGYSSILVNNGSGWHELYRAPNPGQRIFSLAFQTIPTGEPDRLWFNLGDDICWLVMPSKTLKAIYDTNAEFTHESVFISSWHSAGMADIQKTWNSLKVITEGLDGEVTTIEADYQVDEDTNWKPLPEAFTISPSQEIVFPDKTIGKRFRYRLRLNTKDKTKTVRVIAVVIEAIGQVAIKYAYSLPFRSEVGSRNLRGELEGVDPDERQAILDDWADNLTPLTFRCTRELFDNKRVFLNAIEMQTLREIKEGYLGTMTVMEI